MLHSGGLQSFGQALDLDVVGLVAVLLQPRWIGRHEGEALERAVQGDRLPGAFERHGDEAEGLGPGQLLTGAVAEGVQPHAFLADASQVDIGEGDLVADEALRLGQRLATFEHPRLTVPGQVGGGFPRPCGGVDVGGASGARLAGAEQSAGLRLADGDVRSGEVDQHLRSGQGCGA